MLNSAILSLLICASVGAPSVAPMAYGGAPFSVSLEEGYSSVVSSNQILVTDTIYASGWYYDYGDYSYDCYKFNVYNASYYDRFSCVISSGGDIEDPLTIGLTYPEFRFIGQFYGNGIYDLGLNVVLSYPYLSVNGYERAVTGYGLYYSLVELDYELGNFQDGNVPTEFLTSGLVISDFYYTDLQKIGSVSVGFEKVSMVEGHTYLIIARPYASVVDTGVGPSVSIGGLAYYVNASPEPTASVKLVSPSQGESIISAIASGLGLIGAIAAEFVTGFSALFYVDGALTTFGIFSLVFLGISIVFAVVSLVLKVIRGNTGV